MVQPAKVFSCAASLASYSANNGNANSCSKSEQQDNMDMERKNSSSAKKPKPFTKVNNKSVDKKEGIDVSWTVKNGMVDKTPATPVRSISGHLEGDESFSHIGGSIGGSSKPSIIWYQSQFQMSQLTDIKHVINSVCSNYLFARVKFVNKRTDLGYSSHPNSICQHVISQCHLASHVNKESWWIENARYVMSTLTSLRSNRATALRLAFYGKWMIC